MPGTGGRRTLMLAAAFTALGAAALLLLPADRADPSLWAGLAALSFVLLLLLRRLLQTIAAEKGRARLHERLSAAEDALDLLLEQNPTVVYSAPGDGSGRANYISPNLCGLLGYDAEAVLKDPGWWLRGLHPDDRAAVEETIDSSAWPDGRQERIYRFRHADGSWRWLEDRCRLLPSPAGEVALLVGSLTDVTARVATEERFGKMARSLPGAVFEYRLVEGERGHFPYAAGAVWEVCGLRPQDLAIGDEVLFAAMHAADAARLRLARLESAVTGLPWCGEARLRHPAKGEIWLELQAMPERVEGELCRWYGFLTDITQRKAREEQLRRLAQTDPLTGLSNRRHFFEQAAQELRRVARYGRPLAVVMLDIDHFKAVNDNCGHEAGDAVLRDVARCLRSALRESDLLGRVGGEEFAALLPETHEAEALVLAERLRTAVSAAPLGSGLSVTISAGVTGIRGSGAEDLDSALRRADAALYRAKAAGRNQVVLEESEEPPGGASSALVSSLPQPISRCGG